jgi:peroxiredoxin/Tfp pilus assembly protein PilF
MTNRSLFAAVALNSLALTWPLFISPAAAQDDNPVDDQAGGDSVLAGHSYHGEAFNQGPRQGAVLIPGMAKIDFPTSSESEQAQQFVQQGVAQLHGFWYLEAERSFRQAAKEDPDLAIAYWGMAMANVNNSDRARGLIDEAMKRRNKGAGRRERMYIEALDRLIPKAKKKKDSIAGNDEQKSKSKADREAERAAKKKRIERYIADLEKLLHEYPDDLEAKAFLALQLWTGDRAGVKLTSRYAVSAMLGEIFAQNPLHPAHHYRIHLWDAPRSQNALESAALCGPSSPGIAHMWHMPGHIYSKLKRYDDAAWQQEASARVDHAHMIRTRLMPDQIHNFAHNNEWLIRNLLYLGRVDDALDLSRNLVSLPRHPKYNSLKKGGSYKYGRQRLLQTMSQYGLWEELIDEADGPNMPMVNNAAQQEDWLGWLAVAHFMTSEPRQGAAQMRSLWRRRAKLQIQLMDLAKGKTSSDAQNRDTDDGNAKPSRKELEKRVAEVRRVLARGAAAAATMNKDKDVEKLKQHLNTAKLDPLIQAQWLAAAGDLDGAIKLAEKSVRNDKSQVRPLAVLVDLLWRKGDKGQAKEKFKSLRKVAGAADIDTPMLARLAPVAEASEIEGDWRIAPEPADDLGQRPPLDSLGPFRWQPYITPSWNAISADGEQISSENFAGRPRIVIFYLGFGCLHCIEQLHAFAPEIEEFQNSGIELLAISSETMEQLQAGIKNFEEKMEIPLLSDADQQAFKAFRAWDDFEDQPLHGTFLIDGQDRVRWQDIGYEPFTDVDFLLQESKRLLAMP